MAATRGMTTGAPPLPDLLGQLNNAAGNPTTAACAQGALQRTVAKGAHQSIMQAGKQRRWRPASAGASPHWLPFQPWAVVPWTTVFRRG